MRLLIIFDFGVIHLEFASGKYWMVVLLRKIEMNKTTKANPGCFSGYFYGDFFQFIGLR